MGARQRRVFVPHAVVNAKGFSTLPSFYIPAVLLSLFTARKLLFNKYYAPARPKSHPNHARRHSIAAIAHGRAANLSTLLTVECGF